MTENSPIDKIIGGEMDKPPRPALITGIYTGAFLIIVTFAALVAANRMPWLENRALERNAVFCGLFVIFMLIPIVRFYNRPVQMFTSAMIAWGMFVVCYYIAGMFFHNLFEVLRSPFEALIEGAVVYGFFAVGSWVASMALHARHQAIESRRRQHHAAPHHR
jgi:hypothetical protein